jgi:hypothetical protein
MDKTSSLHTLHTAPVAAAPCCERALLRSAAQSAGKHVQPSARAVTSFSPQRGYKTTLCPCILSTPTAFCPPVSHLAEALPYFSVAHLELPFSLSPFPT